MSVSPELFSLNRRIRLAEKSKTIEKIEFLPLTPEHWSDFETLFESNKTTDGCWCMWWRLKNKEFSSAGKEGLKNGMRTIVHSGIEPGLIAYADGVAAGWVAVAPRPEYTRLETSRTLYPVDDQPVWSIPCFFIHRNYRRNHLMERLIEAAAQYAKEHGAQMVEAYPLDVHEKTDSGSIFTGVASIFERSGFVEVARRNERPVMRKAL